MALEHVAVIEEGCDGDLQRRHGQLLVGLDAAEPVHGAAVEILIVQQQADVAVEESQDVVHPVGEAADELVLEFGVFDLHGAGFEKAGGVRGFGDFLGESCGPESAGWFGWRDGGKNLRHPERSSRRARAGGGENDE